MHRCGIDAYTLSLDLGARACPCQLCSRPIAPGAASVSAPVNGALVQPFELSLDDGTCAIGWPRSARRARLSSASPRIMVRPARIRWSVAKEERAQFWRANKPP